MDELFTHQHIVYILASRRRLQTWFVDISWGKQDAGTRSLKSSTCPQPPYMKPLFTSRQEQTHSLRKAHRSNTPFSRTVGVGSHSIQFEGARVWNHLPCNTRCAENLASLKKKLLRTWGDVTVAFVPAIFSNPLFYLVLRCFTLVYLVLLGFSSFQ